jgi:hypothetical protein
VKKEDEKILTAPLTFILSRKGREEMKEIPAKWRGKKRNFLYFGVKFFKMSDEV